MPILRLLATTFVLPALVPVAAGFNGHVATAGPLTVTIAEIPVVKAVGVAVSCPVALVNTSARPLDVSLEMGGLVDAWRAVGAARTDGAFRVTVAEDHLVVTPLPDGADFEVQLRLARLVGRAVNARSVEAIDAAGAVRRAVEFTARDGVLSFTAGRNDFGYRVNFPH